MTEAVAYDWDSFESFRTPAFPEPTGSTDATDERLVSYTIDHSQSTDVSTTYSAQVAALESRFGEAAAELRRYARYADGWDGYRARSFGDHVLGTAKSILAFSQLKLMADSQIPELVTTGPASDGSLDVELRSKSKSLFVTIYPDQPDLRISAILGRDSLEEVRPFESMALATWLDWLFDTATLPPPLDRDQ